MKSSLKYLGVVRVFSEFLLSFWLLSCSSQPLLPEASSVKLSRKAPHKGCRVLGKVTGTVLSMKGSKEEVLRDLKQEAANKGANFVQIKQYSAQGTSVTGMAFQCP